NAAPDDPADSSPPDGVDELVRIVDLSAADHALDARQVPDVGEGIGIEDHQVRDHSRVDAADLAFHAHRAGAADRGGAQHLERGESRLRHELHLTEDG